MPQFLAVAKGGTDTPGPREIEPYIKMYGGRASRLPSTDVVKRLTITPNQPIMRAKKHRTGETKNLDRIKPMKKIPTTRLGDEYGGASCLITAIILILIVSAGFFTLQSFLSTRDDSPEPAAEKIAFDLQELRPGWWETSNRIYFDIPARVVFRLPEGKGGIDPEALSRKIWAEFERIGDIFNPFDPASETARLNREDSRGTISVSKEMHAVFMLSKKLWDASDGAFDPTMLPVKRLWEQAVQSQQIPSNRDIMRTLSRVGFEHVERIKDRHEIRRKTGHLQFDFGGIAKGYAVDHVAALLREHDISAALVALSGEIRTFGKNNDRPWRIGIQHPLKMNDLWGIVSSETDIRVSTSGNYRQPLIIAGHEFYHIFDPRTARPVTEKILGVTTLCSSQKASNALLDGAATAIVVMGVESGLKLANRLGIDALVLKRSRDGRIEEIMTDGFKRHYEPSPQQME